MVTLSISHIFWGVISAVMVVLWFFIVRFFKRTDERFHELQDTDRDLYDKIGGLTRELEHLLGEHDSIKEQCKTKRRK